MKIGSIDVYKFFFSLIVCFYHFYNVVSPNPHLPLGDAAVEFFVIASGVFFFMGWERKKQKYLQNNNNSIEDISPYSFLKRRFLRFLPYTTAGYILAFFVRAWINSENGISVTFQGIIKWLSDDIWEILLIKMNGMNDNNHLLNVPVWTISAMIIVEFIIFAFLTYKEKLFYYIICPLSIIIGFGYWRHIPKANHEVWLGFTTFGVLRVFLLTCLSYYCWELIKKIRETNYSKIKTIFLTLCEFLLYFSAVAIMMNYESRNFRWLATISLFFAIGISVSGKSHTSKFFPAGKITSFLTELSMGIYLTHYPILRIYKHLWPEPNDMFKHCISYFIIVLVSAILFHFIVNTITKFSAILLTRKQR